MDELKFILTFTHTATAVVCTHAPAGFDESMITFERDLTKYFGMFRSYKLPLKFVKADAELLRTEFFTYGLLSSVSIEVQKLNRLTMAYGTAYNGILDFLTFKQSHDFAEITMIDGGLTKLIKDNEGTEYQVENGNFDDTFALRSVYFYDNLNGLACGDAGRIMVTDDGGHLWTQVTSGTTVDLYGITFLTAVCYCCGKGGVILKSINSGATWSALTSGITTDLYSIFDVDATNVYCCGATGKILKTGNAGATWTAQASGTTNDLNGIAFNNVNDGCAVGDSGTIKTTANGGTTWSNVTSGTTNNLYGVGWGPSVAIWVVGDNGFIISNTTSSWVQQTSNTSEHLYSVCYVADGFLGIHYACGASGTILKTSNAGVTWAAQTSTTFLTLRSIFMVVGEGVAVGDLGVCVWTSNAGVTWATTRFDITGDTCWFGVTGYTTRFCFYSKLKDVANALLAQVTNSSTYLVKSDYLDGIEDAVVMTNGHSIRRSGKFESGSINDGFGFFKTSLEAFFKSINSFGCIGMGVEVDTVTGLEILRIETKDYFLQNAEIIDVGEVNEFQLSVKQELPMNTVKFGYEEKNYGQGYEAEQLNESNTYGIFNTPCKSKKEYDIVCKYRADWAGMQIIIDEDIAAELNDSDDYEIFLIAIEKDQFNKMVVFATSIRKRWAQLITTEVCNGDLSPKRSLLRHMAFINSCLWGCARVPDDIWYTSGGNDLLNIETYASDPDISGAEIWLSESDDVVLEAPTLFLPLAISFQAPYPSMFAETLATSNASRGYISFEYNNQAFKGWIVNMDVKLSGKGAVKYELLLTADANVNALIQ
jgi:photosystem II stability/assembly factor-like uncharacterized protein